MRKKLPSLKHLKKRAWDTFSKWIRNRDADDMGFCKCVTCEKRGHWKLFHAGHFVKSGHAILKFDEHNVHAQCPSCNTYRGGMQDEYAKFIIDRYGLKEFNRIMELKKVTSFKRNRQDYEEIVESYK